MKHELVKAAGAVCWVVGGILVFVWPVGAITPLAVAVLATISSVETTRKRRHAELVAAAKGDTV